MGVPQLAGRAKERGSAYIGGAEECPVLPVRAEDERDRDGADWAVDRKEIEVFWSDVAHA